MQTSVCIFASSLLGRPNLNDFKKNLFVLIKSSACYLIKLREGPGYVNYGF